MALVLAVAESEHWGPIQVVEQPAVGLVVHMLPLQTLLNLAAASEVLVGIVPGLGCLEAAGFLAGSVVDFVLAVVVVEVEDFHLEFELHQLHSFLCFCSYLLSKKC